MMLFELMPGMVFQIRSPWSTHIEMIISVDHHDNGSSTLMCLRLHPRDRSTLITHYGGTNDRIFVGDWVRVN